MTGKQTPNYADLTDGQGFTANICDIDLLERGNVRSKSDPKAFEGFRESIRQTKGITQGVTVRINPDDPKTRYGKRMIMCHMIGGTEAELHAMAARIGVNKEWYQVNASTPHYDICQTKRTKALENGAVEVY